MERIEFLKTALLAGKADDLGWMFSAFSITRPGANGDKRHLAVVSQPWGYQYLNDKLQLDDIEGAKPGQPLFSFQEELQVDSSWGANIKEPTTTKIGNLIFNMVVVKDSFGWKFPFQNGKLSIGGMEKYIASRVKSTPKAGEFRDESALYVDEYLKFRDHLSYMEHLAPLVNWSTTRKGITKDPAMAAYRKQLQEEYGDSLNDPLVLAEYEGKLKAFDKEWLKDDPAYGNFLSGKILNISRKKMFIGIGSEDRMDIKDPLVTVKNTLEEGIPTDPKDFVAVVNGARAGSYSRGTETINGGVVAKTLIRVGSNVKIDVEDCGTTSGVQMTYTKDNVDDLVGHSIVLNGRSIFLEKKEDALHYLDRPLTVRSAAKCKAGPGDRFCKVCAGARMSRYEQGVVIPFTEASSIILTSSLKAMHGKILSTAEVDLMTALT